jgi:putative glutamine amidotransferase
LTIKEFMAKRPRIGLTMRLELETRRFYLGRDYCEALEAAGAIPTHIPLIPKPEYISDVLQGLDGVLLPGCDSDIDPAYYGEEPHSKLGRVVPEKDETDLLVLAEAERLGLPVLAICFGVQALNVSRGGSLIQDIESQVPDCIKHRQGEPLERNSHGIRIEEGSILNGLAAAEARVNSHHHQAVREPGRDLRATAWAKDGVIECVEDTRTDRFAMGVQWHPELSWSTDDLSRRIFELFAARCGTAVSSSHNG